MLPELRQEACYLTLRAIWGLAGGHVTAPGHCLRQLEKAGVVVSRPGLWVTSVPESRKALWAQLSGEAQVQEKS